MLYSDEIGIPRSDFSKWRLRTTKLGGQKWEYLDNPSDSDRQDNLTKYLLNEPGFQPPITEKPKSILDATFNAANFFTSIQDENSGTWPVQYKGPMFMTIGYVAVCYFTKTPIPEYERRELIRYIINTSHPVDGGWGLHEVDKSTCFGTTINYVILRLLGLDASHPVCLKARRTLHKLGGAIGNPHWGKASLAGYSKPLQLGGSKSCTNRIVCITVLGSDTSNEMVGAHSCNLHSIRLPINCKSSV